MVAKTSVRVPSSKVKVAIAQVLMDEGYIDGFKVKTEDGKAEILMARSALPSMSVNAKSDVRKTKAVLSAVVTEASMPEGASFIP